MSLVPQYYRPYIESIIASTHIPVAEDASATLHELRDQQLRYEVVFGDAGQPVSANPLTSAAKRFDEEQPEQSNKLGSTLIGGIGALQAELPGAAPVARYQFGTSAAGDIANRIDTYLGNHPDALNGLDPSSAAAFGQQLVAAARQDIDAPGGLRVAGGTMDVEEGATRLLMRHAEGSEPLHVGEAIELARDVQHEVQRTVTPVPVDSTSPISWIDEATHRVASLWPGAVAHTAKVLGISEEFDAIEQAVKDERLASRFEGPGNEHVRSLVMMLNASGINTAEADASTAAFDVLQARPLEDVPAALAGALLTHAKLPLDSVDYFAQRIAESGGSPGNVRGVIAQIGVMRRDAERQQKAPAPAPAPTPEPTPVPDPEPLPTPEPGPEPSSPIA